MDAETELIIKGLNISKDRYTYIISYIERVIKDYKGHPVYIMKEIPVNYPRLKAGACISECNVRDD